MPFSGLIVFMPHICSVYLIIDFLEVGIVVFRAENDIVYIIALQPSQGIVHLTFVEGVDLTFQNPYAGNLAVPGVKMGRPAQQHGFVVENAVHTGIAVSVF